MASYLLNTRDEAMERYKAAAKAEGIALAEWLRRAAEAKATEQTKNG